MFQVCIFTDNTVTLPGIVERNVYVSTTNSQYLDNAVEFLDQEVLSSFGDLMVSLVA